jgi:hypothetical protein
MVWALLVVLVLFVFVFVLVFVFVFVPAVPIGSPPVVVPPTGTVRELAAGTIMPFSGFGITSSTWWLTPAASTKSAS